MQYQKIERLIRNFQKILIQLKSRKWVYFPLPVIYSVQLRWFILGKQFSEKFNFVWKFWLAFFFFFFY